jgi:hypothetical protein
MSRKSRARPRGGAGHPARSLGGRRNRGGSPRRPVAAAGAGIGTVARESSRASSSSNDSLPGPGTTRLEAELSSGPFAAQLNHLIATVHRPGRDTLLEQGPRRRGSGVRGRVHPQYIGQLRAGRHALSLEMATAARCLLWWAMDHPAAWRAARLRRAGRWPRQRRPRAKGRARRGRRPRATARRGDLANDLALAISPRRALPKLLSLADGHAAPANDNGKMGRSPIEYCYGQCGRLQVRRG